MNLKTRKFLVQLTVIVVIVGISGWVGDYAAWIVSTSTTVKNSMLVQIIFFIGLVAGCLMGLVWQELDRRYPSQNPDELPKKGADSPEKT
ncbi:MAG: hypothetical protein ABSB80_00345 [Methanoregula sp.]|jgi:hypothetical protein|uniref:hypothetical protein n=1 Tax=Methanoregula sp. TaxID=2052170 RepID=UPI003D0D46BC